MIRNNNSSYEYYLLITVVNTIIKYMKPCRHNLLLPPATKKFQLQSHTIFVLSNLLLSVVVSIRSFRNKIFLFSMRTLHIPHSLKFSLSKWAERSPLQFSHCRFSHRRAAEWNFAQVSSAQQRQRQMHTIPNLHLQLFPGHCANMRWGFKRSLLVCLCLSHTSFFRWLSVSFSFDCDTRVG